MFLCNALGDPDDVAAFLLLELQIRIEDSEVELLHERINVQFDLRKKSLLNLIESQL